MRLIELFQPIQGSLVCARSGCAAAWPATTGVTRIRRCA